MKNKVISWEEYFIGIAKLSALRSKDPSTQVGACIVNEDKRIVSIGYNGLPYNCSDDEFPWVKNGDYKDTKYPYVVHAEANAILNSNSDLKGTSLYVTLFPCSECAKLIIQSKIKEVFYLEDKYSASDSTIAAKRMFDASGVKYTKLDDFEVIVK